MKYIIPIIILILAGSIGGVIGKEAGGEIYRNLFQGGGTKPEIISKTGFTQVGKDAYIQGCIQSGGNEQYCECTFKYIKDKIAPTDLKVILEDYQKTNKLPEILLRAEVACVSESESLRKVILEDSTLSSSSKNTELEIEKCRIDSKNIDLEKVGKSFENTVNQMVKDGIQLSNDQIKNIYDDYIQDEKDTSTQSR